VRAGHHDVVRIAPGRLGETLEVVAVRERVVLSRSTSPGVAPAAGHGLRHGRDGMSSVNAFPSVPFSGPATLL